MSVFEKRSGYHGSIDGWSCDCLQVVGTEGTLEIVRGGWGGSRGEYTLTSATKSAQEPVTRKFPFSGVDNAMALFVSMIQAAKGGGGFKAVLEARKERNADFGFDALSRASCEEGLMDLALMDAMLVSALQGGQPTPVMTPQQIDLSY